MSFVIAIAFGEVYLSIQDMVSTPSWLTIACVNTVLALTVIIKLNFFSKDTQANKPSDFTVWRWKFPITYSYIPSLFIVISVLGLSITSSFIGNPTRALPSYNLVYFALWIPIIEEIVFRIGVGGYFRRLGGALFGGYCSALLFAFVHDIPTVEKALQLQFNIPIGPFLLGVICEYIYHKTKRALPIITFHSACNLAGPLFGMIDERWLDWLSFLFLKNI